MAIVNVLQIIKITSNNQSTSKYKRSNYQKYFKQVLSTKCWAQDFLHYYY